MTKAKHILGKIQKSVTDNFRYATLHFIFIILFIGVFEKIFGAENSIVGVIFTIMMMSSMVRDWTGAPVKHFCFQSFILLLMAAAACLVSNAPPFLALPVNLIMMFLILYAFTYEYVSQLYFPYILAYLFLVFISPVSPAQLPKRLMGMLAGAVCIIFYQLINGRKRVSETAQDVLTAMSEKACVCIESLLNGQDIAKAPEALRCDLCKLSKVIYDRRKKALCISDASFSMLDAGRGLESLVFLLYGLEGNMTPAYEELLHKTASQLSACRAYILAQADSIPSPEFSTFVLEGDMKSQQIYECLCYIRKHILKMAHPDNQKKYRKTLLSFSVRLKAALNVSPVRVVYALRVACLLAVGTLAVQLLHLEHGRWLLFTLASVSLPYADDVGEKAKKRMVATLLGVLVGGVLYALIPSPTVRTVIMMLSGYLSFYFSDYSMTFTCSTLGALGGAVFQSAFGWQAVGNIVLIRTGYIMIGILLALLINCILFPFKRKKATQQLWKKYVRNTELLTNIIHTAPVDPQLYYSLVIQSHLLEDKLLSNAEELSWEDAKEKIRKCQQAVRLAHRRPPSSLQEA